MKTRIVALLLVVGLVVGTAYTAVAIIAGGRDDDALVGEVEATGITLYLPEIRDWTMQRVAAQGAVVTAEMFAEGYYRGNLVQGVFGGGDLCEELALVDDGGTCESDGTTLRYSFEEQSTVAVLRGSTLLIVAGFTSEADATLVEDVVEALEEAPQVSAADLVDASAR